MSIDDIWHRATLRAECDVSVLKLFPFFSEVSDSISEKFDIEKSIGFGIKQNWYKKVSVLYRAFPYRLLVYKFGHVLYLYFFCVSVYQ